MNKWMRSLHRWLSVVFTLAVIANFVAMAVVPGAITWVTYTPLPPLLLMLVSGIYLFVLPYTSKGRATIG